MNYKYSLIFLIVFFLLVPFKCFLIEIEGCQEREKLTLTNLLTTALSNNPQTRVAWWNAQRAAAAFGSAKSAYYPQVAFDANATNGRDFKFRNGPDVDYTTLSANIVVTMMLFDFGERSSEVAAAASALEAAGWRSQWTIQKVMADVFENGYGTLYAQEKLEALLLSLKDAEKMLETVESLNRAGLRPISDVYSSKASLAQIQMEVAQQKGALEISRARLATTLGLDADTPICLAPIDALVVPKKSLSSLISLAKETRQDILSQRAAVVEAFARRSKTAAMYMPKLSFYGRGGADHAVKDKADAAHYQVSLNLEVPLFTGFDALYQNRRAAADVKVSEEELIQLELQAALEVLTQSSNFESSKSMLEHAKDNLLYAQLAYDGTLEKYNAGKESFAELSIALRQLINARIRFQDVHVKYLTSIANLAYAAGTLNLEDRCTNS